MTGTIPAELGSLTNLEVLSLSGNQLTAIPADLGNLANLRTLYLDGNQLAGCLPQGLRRIRNNDFYDLDLPLCNP